MYIFLDILRFIVGIFDELSHNFNIKISKENYVDQYNLIQIHQLISLGYNYEVLRSDLIGAISH